MTRVNLSSVDLLQQSMHEQQLNVAQQKKWKTPSNSLIITQQKKRRKSMTVL